MKEKDFVISLALIKRKIELSSFCVSEPQADVDWTKADQCVDLFRKGFPNCLKSKALMMCDEFCPKERVSKYSYTYILTFWNFYVLFEKKIFFSKISVKALFGKRK